MNVFDFVEEMEKQYGEDWKFNDLSEEEQLIYNVLRDEWNYSLGYPEE